MDLYTLLLEKGYKNQTYPENKIDIFFDKYKILQFLYKPKYRINDYTLVKNNIIVYFDLFLVTIYCGDDCDKAFGKSYTNEQILSYIYTVENELKIKHRKEKFKRLINV